MLISKEYAPLPQLDRGLGYEPRRRGFESLKARHVGTSFACSDFFIQKNQSPATLSLLFRKKARSALLFECIRTHNVSLSLTPFYEYAFGEMCLFFLQSFWEGFEPRTGFSAEKRIPQGYKARISNV